MTALVGEADLSPTVAFCLRVTPEAGLDPSSVRVSRRYGISGSLTERSFRLDVGRPDHLGPLLDFFSNEGPEIGRGAGKDRATEVGKLSLQLGIGKAGIDFLVELVDDLAGRLPGGADSEETTRFVTRNKFAHAREVRQRL